jgi:hypothetical protein
MIVTFLFTDACVLREGHQVRPFVDKGASLALCFLR